MLKANQQGRLKQCTIGVEMPKKDLIELYDEFRQEFDDIQSSCIEDRRQSLEDRRFGTIAGAQYEGWLGNQFSNKPKFENNKIHLSTLRIMNEYLNNRITVDFKPSDGSNNDNLSDACDKLYRADEIKSSAEEAYDNAMQEAINGGYGAYRFVAEYVNEDDPEDERQHICIKPILDADVSVFFSLDSKRQDKADAKRCYVITSMTHREYESKYDDSPSSWPRDERYKNFDWVTPDVVYIAEVYDKVKEKENVHIWQHLGGETERFSDEELDDDKLFYLKTIGAEEIDVKTRFKNVVYKYIMDGSKIFDNGEVIPGPNIPIVMQYGKRWFIDNIERACGHVRHAKDMQRLLNMQLSKLAEIAALSPVEKPIVTTEQILGHETEWAQDNIENNAFLHINPVTDENGNEQPLGPVAYTKPPQVPPALAAIVQATEADIKELLGNTQQGEEITGNISTQTALIISNRLDMQAFVYMANAAKARKRGGEIWLGMAPITYWEEGRKMKGIDSQGESSQIELMRRVIDNSTGREVFENDLSKVDHDVHSDVGPASSTRREATARSLRELIGLTEDPQDRKILGTMALLNMDIEGGEDLKDYYRNQLVRLGVLKPNEEEKKQLALEAQNRQPDPETKYLESAAAAEDARGQKALADTLLTQAKTDETRVKTAETLATIDREDTKQTLEMLNALGPRVEPNEGV